MPMNPVRPEKSAPMAKPMAVFAPSGAGSADRERIQEHRRVAREDDVGQQHRGRRRHAVGLEQVGRHAGAVADVVADVVRDHRRVARVVLGDAGLDLAHQVGTDVGALGEYAAAKTRKDGDERAAEAEADQGSDHVAQGLTAAGSIGAEKRIKAGHAEQT